MERTRLVLIFSALAFAFSVSSVEAQEPEPGLCEAGEEVFDWNEIVNPNRCDKDGDCYVKNNTPCIRDNSDPPAGIDCDDSDPNLNTDCSGGDPEPDPEPTKGTPIIVTFDDWATDTIQSDGVDGNQYKHDGLKTGVSAILNGRIFLNLRAGGVRKLFIDFGPAVDCGAGDSDSNCVVDDSNAPVAVECPFPTGLRTQQDGTLKSDSCSALVKAALTEHDAFEGDPVPEVLAHIEDMNPGDTCPADGCGGPIIKVRPFQEWDIEFNVPRPKGNKSTGWSITFSDKEGNCPDGTVPPVPAGHSFPDFLSIRAIDMVGDGVADTWHIGTLDQNADNIEKLACLLKAQGGPPTDFIGFFTMSFMYTVEICPVGENENECPAP